MVLIELPNWVSRRELQRANTLSPIDETEFGKQTELKFSHPSKALLSIEVTGFPSLI